MAAVVEPLTAHVIPDGSAHVPKQEMPCLGSIIGHFFFPVPGGASGGFVPLTEWGSALEFIDPELSRMMVRRPVPVSLEPDF